MKKYKITTQEVGGCPLEEYGEVNISLVEAESTQHLIQKMGWGIVDISHKMYNWSCGKLFDCIENGETCFFRHDEKYFDNELYIWDGENADGTRIEIEIVSDEEDNKKRTNEFIKYELTEEEEIVKIILSYETYIWEENSFNGKGRLSLEDWVKKYLNENKNTNSGKSN